MVATVYVLTVGYADERVAGTVCLIREDDIVMVVDPGMVATRSKILGPLRELGIEPDDVTDVVLSHHHPDHTVNIALFPRAKVHDFQATYIDDQWIEHGDDFALSPSVRLVATPGHTPQDITTLATTADGLVALTHLWWSSAGPAQDPFCEDEAQLAQSRRRVLDLRPARIIPGHGEPFEPGPTTPV